MGRPRVNTRLILLALAVIILSTVAAGAISRMEGVGGGVTDTPMRASLLEKKKTRGISLRPDAVRSRRFSGALYDVEIGAAHDGPLPWAASVPAGPGGTYGFTWRVKLSFNARFAVEPADPEADFSVRVLGRDGMPVYSRTRSAVLPAEAVTLGPDIYVIKAVSSTPLTLLRASITPAGTGPEKAAGAGSFRTIRMRLGPAAMRDLERMARIGSDSTGTQIVKMPGGRVTAELLDERGAELGTLKVGLSGRTREHLEWFPSIDVKASVGASLDGIPSFKLYRVGTKSGAFDISVLTVLEDMGYPVPRLDIVRLVVNGREQGVYILQENATPAMFSAAERLEGSIVGLDAEKFFFDYPYGGILDAKYYHRPAAPEGGKGPAKLKTSEFLSAGFVDKIDRDAFAEYIAFASFNLSTHGLGIDDLRFYEDPATGLYTPIPRDLNPGVWRLTDSLRMYMAHFTWSSRVAPYTLWPTRKLLPAGYRFDRTGDLFEGVRENPTGTGLTDIHNAITAFLSDPSNLRLANGYLLHFSRNDALREKIRSRIMNVLMLARKEAPGEGYLAGQYAASSKGSGVTDFKGIEMMLYPRPGPFFRTPEGVYFWNVRTSLALDDRLAPSLTAPLSTTVPMGENQEALYYSFLTEKRIFELLEENGLRPPGRTFARVRGRESEAVSPPFRAEPSEEDGTRFGRSGAGRDVAVYTGTLLKDESAIVLFLVRNATEADGYSLVLRDGLTSIAPSVNETFSVGGPAGNRLSRTDDIMKNRFRPGERMRLVAFELELGKNAIFYRMQGPPGTSFLHPPLDVPADEDGRYRGGA